MTTSNIYTALIKAKQDFGPVLKNKNNPAFKSKYANLDAVLEAVEPALLANGIMLTQPTRIVNDQQWLSTILVHAESGESIESQWLLKPAKEDPQGYGSALSYGRRYSVLSILSIAPEDDDGNAASQRPAPPAAPPRDWLVELSQATSADQVMSLGRQAANVGEFDKYAAQFHARKTELETPMHEPKA